MSMGDLSQSFRRAEVWKSETATLAEVVNVLGRWESSEQWKARTVFREDVVENLPLFFEDEAQGYTLKRHEMAQRLGMVERVALRQNIGDLPFTNAPLAASCGKGVAFFDEMPVSEAAANIVFDALAQSKSGLVPPATCDERRAAWFAAGKGDFDVAAFSSGLQKAQAVVLASSAVLYVGLPAVVAALFAKVLHIGGL